MSAVEGYNKAQGGETERPIDAPEFEAMLKRHDEFVARRHL